MITNVLTAGSPFAAASAYAGGNSANVFNAGQNTHEAVTTVLSPQALQASTDSQTDNASDNSQNNSETSGNSNGSSAASNAQAQDQNQSSGNSTNGSELTPSEESQVRALKKRDAEVHAHEQAHKTVGGQYTGAAQYSYTSGPDGHRYATAGEVSIDSSPIRDNPEATIRKMDIVIRAALAPSDPSPQDHQVAAAARQTRLQAQSQLQQQRSDALGGGASPAAVANAVQAYQQNNIDPGYSTGKSIPEEHLTIIA